MSVPEIYNLLSIDMVVDITTIGRKSGEDRRIEIWCHLMDGKLFLAGFPGTRSWYANLVANPEVTLHLKHLEGADNTDLRVRARPIVDEAERRDVLTRLGAQSAFRQRQGLEVESWVAASKMAELVPVS